MSGQQPDSLNKAELQVIADALEFTLEEAGSRLSKDATIELDRLACKVQRMAAVGREVLT